MSHPYIDCGVEFRGRGIDPEQIANIEAETAEGIVHRLWEPLAMKHSPPNGYAAKFSTPYAIAAGILKGDAGLGEYDEAVVKDPAMVRLASKVRYIVDPDICGSPSRTEKFMSTARVISRAAPVIRSAPKTSCANSWRTANTAG